MLNFKFLIKFVLLILLIFGSEFTFADSMQRGDYGTTSTANGVSMFAESSPVLNVPLPSASTKYYYNYESNESLYLSYPIKTINKIVVYVNKGVITSNQIDDKVQEALNNFKQKGMTPPGIMDIRSRVIEQLIMQKIQLDLAARTGIKTTDLEITDAVNSIAKNNKMTLDQFRAMLAKQGLPFDEFRKQIQIQITTDKLKQREVDGRVTVSDDEVKLVMNSEAYKSRIDYNLGDIIVGIPEQAGPEIVEQKHAIAMKAYNELKGGTPFYQVAAKYSNAPNALTGGDLGWRTNAALPPQILAALNNLTVGQFTELIHMPVGYFIFKVNDIKKHGEPQIVRQYHVRHILVKINEITSDDEAHQKILSIKAMLDADAKDPTKQNADFIKFAKQYSQDTSSINGGDLGWVSKGDTVPAFEQAMMSTPVGVISQPVHSPFGWHLLEVLGTRDSNLTNDKEKAEVRQEIHENKAGLLYNQWLRDIRDSAYVKMNDN